MVVWFYGYSASSHALRHRDFTFVLTASSKLVFGFFFFVHIDQELFPFMNLLLLHLKLLFNLHLKIRFQLSFETGCGNGVECKRADGLYKVILMKNVLERRQGVFNFTCRSDVIYFLADFYDVLGKANGDVLLSFLYDFEVAEGKHLFEILFTDLWTNFRAKNYEGFSVEDRL